MTEKQKQQQQVSRRKSLSDLGRASRAPSPIIFCISCGLGVEISHYVGQDARLHVVFTRRRDGAQLVLRWVPARDLYFQAVDETVTYDLHTYTHMKGVWPSRD